MARADRHQNRKTGGRAIKKGPAAAAKRSFPPEAYDYGGDISAEAVRRLQEQADKVLGKGEWKVIDGYVGPEETRVARK